MINGFCPFVLNILFNFGKYRRDFRMLIADPNDPKKSMANPVIWFSTELVIEVNIYLYSINDK
jgi:hypothetical protein